MMPITLGKALRFGTAREQVSLAESLQLVGVWELQSIHTEFRDGAERRLVDIALPAGYLLFTPLGRVLAMVTHASRAQSGAEREGETLFRSTFAYSGQFRLEGERWITRVDRTWSDAWTDEVQVHWFKVEVGRLDVLGAWHLGKKPDERLQRTVFGFKSMKLRPN